MDADKLKVLIQQIKKNKKGVNQMAEKSKFRLLVILAVLGLVAACSKAPAHHRLN
jgi:hypothetical protein